MTRKDFLEAVSLAAIAFADRLGLVDEVAQSEPTPPPADPFKGGTVYPEEPGVVFHDTIVAPGATVAYGRITLSEPAIHTVIAHPVSRDGTGPTYGRVNGSVSPAVRFLPGETEKTFQIPVRPMKEGQHVLYSGNPVPDLGRPVDATGKVLCTALEPATQPIAATPPPPAFEPVGTLVYDKKGAEIAFTDDGTGGTFATRLPHGRTQTGNKETGFYAPKGWGNFAIDGDDLILRTWKLDSPHIVDSYATYHVASVLSGHRATETHLKYGTFEFEAMMPSRAGTWPALWFLPPKGWPPEIDLFEGFYHTPNKHNQLSSGMHFGEEGNWQKGRTLVRWAGRHTMTDFGLKPTLTTELHKFACTITPEWVIMYVDGVETIRLANPFAGVTWFPIMNVAVKADPADTYDKGTANMVLRRVRIWRQS